MVAIVILQIITSDINPHYLKRLSLLITYSWHAVAAVQHVLCAALRARHAPTPRPRGSCTP